MQNHTRKWLVVGLLGLCGLGGVAAVQAQTAATQNAANDTQRDANQQQRIEQGLNRQDARMQGRQAHVGHKEHLAGTHNGRVGPREQKRIQHADNRDSRRVHHVKHNAAKR